MTQPPDLTPEQKADAARLMATFRQWKADERARGNAGTQEAVAHALRISQSAFSQFCRGIRPLNAELLTKMHQLFGWEPAEISPGLAKKMAGFAAAVGADEHDEHVPIKMVDAKASAGAGELVLSTDVSKMLMFRRDYLTKNAAKPSDVIAFEVRGHSMVDMHIVDGAVVLANRARRDPISRRVYVVWLDGELFVKQLVKHEGGWIARSHNSDNAEDYPDIPVANPDDRIVGRAFWCGFGL